MPVDVAVPEIVVWSRVADPEKVETGSDDSVNCESSVIVEILTDSSVSVMRMSSETASSDTNTVPVPRTSSVALVSVPVRAVSVLSKTADTATSARV